MFSRFFLSNLSCGDSVQLLDTPMMRNGIVGIVGIFAEPEVWILDPLDMGVGLAGRVEMEIGIHMPGEEVARIAPEEIEVGITARSQQRGGDVLRYPADLRIEKFGDDVRLASVRQGDRAIGLPAPLEALADEQPRGD